jgi:hypothetical protein
MFSLRLKCWVAYSRLTTRICCRKYNDLMFIYIIPNVCKIHHDRSRRQRSKCWWFVLSLNLRKVRKTIFIRSGNHTAQINNLVCVRFNYSKTTGTCFIPKIYTPSSSLLQGKYLPFSPSPSPLRLNIFRLFVILSLTQLYRYTPEIFLFSTWTRIFRDRGLVNILVIETDTATSGPV